MNIDISRWGIIYNPKAGSRRKQKRWDKIRDCLEARKVKYDYVQSEGYGSVERLARQLAESGYKTIVVVGGDGAMNDAVNGIMTSSVSDDPELALGLIPNGIGNDFARFWGIESDNYEQAVDNILHRRLRRIDVGNIEYANGEMKIRRHFVNAVNIGLTARVVKITGEARRFWGIRRLSLLASVIMLGFERKLYRFHLRINGEHIRGRIMSVCVGSAHGYGQTPSAVPYNGWLDVSVIYRPRMTGLLQGLRLLAKGRILNHKVVKPYRTRQVKVMRAQNASVSVDGRILREPECPLEIGIEREKLNFIIPE